jgi:choline dehydrogenase-like flavoprotein
MNADQPVDDVIIIGAGPAGTSAGLALAAQQRPVRVLDAGTSTTAITMPPAGAYLELRFSDPSQWRWQLGERFEGVAPAMSTSPKLRVPGLRRIFEGYAEANHLQGDAAFQLVGALAAGGLSNAWGCGVAAFSGQELDPLDAQQRREMQDAYHRVGQRMGLSGAEDDALRDYFGVDDWAGPALPLDAVHARLWRNCQRIPRAAPGLRLGRARVAVLAKPRAERQACDLLRMCLWGCERRATWSAAMDADVLKRLPGVAFEPNVVVERLRKEEDVWRIECLRNGDPHAYRARRVLLGAGTLASTRLALAALPARPPEVRLLSNPMAAFLLVSPALLGRGQDRGFGLAQLSFELQHAFGGESAFGNLFSTAGIPVNEFLPYVPATRRAALPLLRTLLPACIVGNLFMPGSLSAHSVRLNADGTLQIRGGEKEQLADALVGTRIRLARGFRAAGSWMLPGSFLQAKAGADMHYAGTLPMRRHPRGHECDSSGQLAGLPGVFVIDGASLPMLPAKAHTLTIMANADRIARQFGAWSR